MFCDAKGNPTGSNKGMETIWTHSVMSFESTQRFKQHEIRLKPNVPDMNDMDRCDVISNVKISNTKPDTFSTWTTLRYDEIWSTCLRQVSSAGKWASWDIRYQKSGRIGNLMAVFTVGKGRNLGLGITRKKHSLHCLHLSRAVFASCFSVCWPVWFTCIVLMFFVPCNLCMYCMLLISNIQTDFRNPKISGKHCIHLLQQGSSLGVRDLGRPWKVGGRHLKTAYFWNILESSRRHNMS